jgi:hypothetical protein
MHKPRHTVKPTVTGDVEEDLLRKRMARREANYQKLCTTIERTQRKLEKADRTVTRSVKLLTKLERQRRRAQKQMAEPLTVEPKPEHPKVEAREQAVANALVEPTVSDVTDVPNSEVFGGDLTDIPVEAKPKRQRKPKATDAKPESGSPGPAVLEAYLNRPFVEARQARMKSLGFRKTSKPR